MKKHFLTKLIILCVLTAVLTLSASAEMIRIDTADTIVGSGYRTADAQSGTFQEFAYSVPKDGATVLIFFSSQCGNSQSLMSRLDQCQWLSDPHLNVVAVETKFNDPNVVLEFSSTYTPNMASSIDYRYTSGNSLMFAYYHLFSSDYSLTWPVVMVITDSGDGPIVRYGAEAMTSASMLYDTLLAVSPGFYGSQGAMPPQEEPEPEDFPFTSEEWTVLALANRERHALGLQPLTGVSLLQKACDIRAAELSRLFSHTRPDGSSCFTALSEVGMRYGSAGENIAYGYPTPAAVMTGWMNSDGHRANILGDYDHLGVGNIGTNWVQMFTGSYRGGYTSFTLLLPENLSVPAGTAIEGMGLLAVLESSETGICYLPILSEYCAGYRADTLGTQTVSVSVLGFETSFDVTVQFADVKEEDYFSEAVAWAVEKGITNGTSETTFSPEAPCNRAQVVTFLWRSAGSPEPASSANPFVDVSAGEYYSKAVLWAVENDITKGMDATHFDPTGTCTRAQVVTFLHRSAGSPAPAATSHSFTDVTADYYYNAMLWAVEKGITTGMTPTTFVPGGTCTRGQIVTFLHRAEN